MNGSSPAVLAVGERNVKEVEPERNTALRGPIGSEACWWLLWRVVAARLGQLEQSLTPSPASLSSAPGASSLLWGRTEDTGP